MNEFKHHGILGMKWGVRRYQNPDGSLTKDGKKRYNKDFNEKGIAISKKAISTKTISGSLAEIVKNKYIKKQVDKKTTNKIIEESKRTKRLKNKLNDKNIKNGKHKVGSLRTRLLQKKLHESEIRDKINAGSSKMQKVWNKITNGDKYAAQAYISVERYEKKQASKRAAKKKKAHK